MCAIYVTNVWCVYYSPVIHVHSVVNTVHIVYVFIYTDESKDLRSIKNLNLYVCTCIAYMPFHKLTFEL